jgi:glycosyltransferase involved in cell wall biosynthesis
MVAGKGLRGAARRGAASGVDAALRALTAPAVMRRPAARGMLSRVVAERNLPDRLRVRLARRALAAIHLAGDPAGAAAVGYAAAARLRDPAAKADLLVASAYAAGGEAEIEPLRSAAAAELAHADRAYAAGDPRAAAAAYTRATAVLFHRELHFDRLASPLAADPEGYLAPLRASRVAAALTARLRRVPPATPPADRPLRLLVATRANRSFVGEILRRYEDMPGVELRFLDLAADPAREPLTRRTTAMAAALLGGDPAYEAQVEAWLRPHLDWADTVLVEWCVSTAVLFTLVDPGDARIVVRLHSFEAFSPWPHLVTFGRVDDVVFVSEPVRRFAGVVLPVLAEPPPAHHVIPNAMHLARFRRPKRADARFVVGLVGVGSVAKDPRWAVEVLRLLRARDRRYRLRLVGVLGAGPTDSTRRYHRQLLADLDADAGVERLGQTDDVPSALTGIGVILSASVRESFHVAVVEGAASGAVPVVRDWPFFAPYGGARGIYPDGWVVTTPAEAAARILAATATEQGWRAAGEEASKHALASWDWPIVRRLTDRLLLGGDRSAAGDDGPA